MSLSGTLPPALQLESKGSSSSKSRHGRDGARARVGWEGGQRGWAEETMRFSMGVLVACPYPAQPHSCMLVHSYLQPRSTKLALAPTSRFSQPNSSQPCPCGVCGGGRRTLYVTLQQQLLEIHWVAQTMVPECAMGNPCKLQHESECIQIRPNVQ